MEVIQASGPRHPRHPQCPKSNVPIFKGYDPDKFALDSVPRTLTSSSAVTPGCPPRLTQVDVAQYLVPLTRELHEVPQRPTVAEIPGTVIDRMVAVDRAWWVDAPGRNAYSLQDAFSHYGMVAEIVLPTPQAVFPRSYQYELECVRHRRQHACDGLRTGDKRALLAHCRDCAQSHRVAGPTAFQLKWSHDPAHSRWRDYPDLTASLAPAEVTRRMSSVGRPFRNEACAWYNEHYPSKKYDTIVRKFGK